jgi:hypothetical protein
MSSASANSSNSSSTAAKPLPPSSQEGPTALQLGIMVIVLGSSAGFTLYTKKTGSMLSTMNKIAENQLRNRGPPKFGPPTRQEWEKLRPRFDKDDLF